MKTIIHDVRNFAGAIIGSLSLVQTASISDNKKAVLIANAFRSAIDLQAYIDKIETDSHSVS